MTTDEIENTTTETQPEKPTDISIPYEDGVTAQLREISERRSKILEAFVKAYVAANLPAEFNEAIARQIFDSFALHHHIDTATMTDRYWIGARPASDTTDIPQSAGEGDTKMKTLISNKTKSTTKGTFKKAAKKVTKKKAVAKKASKKKTVAAKKTVARKGTSLKRGPGRQKKSA